MTNLFPYIKIFPITIEIVQTLRRIMKQVHIMKHLGLSNLRQVYFIRKSTEFHDMRTECQKINNSN